MRIVFAGHIGRGCLGGQAWAAMQYLAGLRDLGHDVYYLEDCGQSSWVYNWQLGEWTFELDYPSEYVSACMELLGLGNKWLYRAGEESRGISVEELIEVCSSADLLIMRALPMSMWRSEYDLPRRRAFIDVDPGFTQMRLLAGDEQLRQDLERCERHFTIAQRMDKADCLVPSAGYEWHKTLPPVSVTSWPRALEVPNKGFTAITRWSGVEATYEGLSYGDKDREFPRFFDLPSRSGQDFLVALCSAGPDELLMHGWDVVPGEKVTATPELFQSFVQTSRGEFGVAKHGYVATRSGWFSDRSVCYLASGRPAVLQDTGQGDWLPLGHGVLTFDDLDGALRAVETVTADYEGQRKAARRLAEEVFSTDVVLPPFLDAAMS